MRVSTLALALVLACIAGSAQAQTTIGTEGQKDTPSGPGQSGARPATEAQGDSQSPSRYSFNRVENGFVRLDNENGEIAYCSFQAAGWACQTMSIDHASSATEVESAQKALKAEIARLQDEVASLKKQIAALKEPAPPRPPADLTPQSDKGPDITIKLPTQEDMTRAREFLEETWRRLVEMFGSLRKDIMRKT